MRNGEAVSQVTQVVIGNGINIEKLELVGFFGQVIRILMMIDYVLKLPRGDANGWVSIEVCDEVI